jgi:photosystem II stability/assembly factor-like uncharacterized protein
MLLCALGVLAGLSAACSVTALAQIPASRPWQPAPPRVGFSAGQHAGEAAVVALPVVQFKLMADSTGWVSTGNRLLWTTDNGEHWKDISPSGTAGDRYADVFFLDARTGWVLIPPSDDSAATNFSVAITADGGATWTSTALPEWKYDPEHGERGLSNTGTIAFADSMHGWASLDIEGSTLMASSTLLQTTDGGHSWNWSKGAPDGRIESIVAVSNSEAWLVCDSEGQSELLASRDGGRSFQQTQLPPPPELSAANGPTIETPRFSSDGSGSVAVTYAGGMGAKSAEALFVTRNGGRTWSVGSVVTGLPEISVGSARPSTVTDSVWVHLRAPGGIPSSLIQSPVAGGAIDGSQLGREYCKLSFVTADAGWADCSAGLYSTTDGVHWMYATPRTRNGTLTVDPVTPGKQLYPRTKMAPQLGSSNSAVSTLSSVGATLQSGVSQQLAFDKTDTLTIPEMQTYWNSSPFYNVGIYLPNSPNRHNDPNLVGDNGAAWISAASSQGWGIIPIWFGLQAPCACNPTKANTAKTYPACNHFKHTYSEKSDQAKQDGKNQADKAIASAVGLGLDGTVIYEDQEIYDSSYKFADTGTTCGATSQAYLSGFVQEIHANGGILGVYGSVFNVADFAGADDVWIANGSGHRVTVWSLGFGAGDKVFVSFPDSDN